jgi:hypothetical protein
MRFLVWYVGAFLHALALYVFLGFHLHGTWWVVTSAVLWLVLGFCMAILSAARAIKNAAVKAAVNKSRERE